MMPSRFASIVDSAFAETPCAPGRWDFARGGVRIAACLADSWLAMKSPVVSDASPRELLARNAALPGLVKFARDGRGEIVACAQIPIDDAPSAPQLIREACAGFEIAASPFSAVQEMPASPADLTALCAEAGWNFTARSDGSLAVELECRGAFIQASLVARGEGVHVFVELADCEESQTESVSAICALLLTAASAVRLARPAIESRDGKLAPRFEVAFSKMPDAAQLAHALSALSVACAACAEEVAALQNPNVAGEYLALRAQPNGCAHSANKQQKETT